MANICTNRFKGDCEVKKDLNLLLQISNELNGSELNLDVVISLLQKQLKAEIGRASCRERVYGRV